MDVAKAQEPNMHLLDWAHVHRVHVSEFLFTQAVVLVVICMLKIEGIYKWLFTDIEMFPEILQKHYFSWLMGDL